MDQPREKRPHSATPYEYVAPRRDTSQTEQTGYRTVRSAFYNSQTQRRIVNIAAV